MLTFLILAIAVLNVFTLVLQLRTDDMVPRWLEPVLDAWDDGLCLLGSFLPMWLLHPRWDRARCRTVTLFGERCSRVVCHLGSHYSIHEEGPLG